MFEGSIARSYEAISRKDLDAVMSSWADDGVFEFPGHTPISGRHEGKEGVRAFFKQIFDGLESTRFTVRHAAMANPIGLTWSNVMYVEWTVADTTHDGVTVLLDGISAFRFRAGKVVYVRDYFFDTTALDALWARSAVPVGA